MIYNETSKALAALIGSPKTRNKKAGVYIFTHKPSGDKYVGSSNLGECISILNLNT